MTDIDNDLVVLSIDGVGAFDHVSRACIFEQLEATPELHDLIPFVRQWYGGVSKFVWRDDSGSQHVIEQRDGGEQGDALMPALFCLALRPALLEIQSRLAAGDRVFAYLDDIYIVCSRTTVRDSFDIVRECL